MSNFDGMLQRILTIAGTETHLTQQANQFGMDAVYANFQSSGLTILTDHGLHFLLGFLNHFLDSGGVNTSIQNQLLQRNLRDLSPHRIETGKDNRFRSVIDDQIHTSQCLQRADVAAFTTNNTPLHLVAGQLYH